MGFLATNLLLLMVAAGAIYKAYDNAKNSALINAELSIKVLALLIADEDESHLGKTPLFATPTRLQHIIEDVQSLKTDLVVVDRSKKIVADTIKANVGNVFQHDLGNEVGLTMEDRKVRTFLERSIDYPEGIQQMVVPLITAHTGQNIGALIMDYTQEYRQAMDIARNLALTMGVISLLCIVSGIGIGFLVYRGITRDVRRLKDAACTLAEGDLATPIGGIPGELGSVAAALEETRQVLAAAREIVANGLAERTRAEAALTQAHEKMTASLGQIRRRNREMGVLSELGELLQTVDQTSEALPLVNRFMPRLFPQWSGALYMLDNSKVMLEPAVVWGGEAPDLSIFHPDECWGLRRGRPHVVEDPAVGLCCPHS
jgi:methyl-accepting chemotaxis protein